MRFAAVLSLLLIAVACADSGLRAAKESELDQVTLTEADVGPNYKRVVNNTRGNDSEMTFRADDGQSCLETEISVLSGDGKPLLDQARQVAEFATPGASAEELITPKDAVSNALVLHRSGNQTGNCLGNSSTGQYEIMLYRSNVLAVLVVPVNTDAGLLLALTSAKTLAQRIEATLAN